MKNKEKDYLTIQIPKYEPVADHLVALSGIAFQIRTLEILVLTGQLDQQQLLMMLKGIKFQLLKEAGKFAKYGSKS